MLKKTIILFNYKVTIIHNNFKKFYGAETFKEPLQLVINYQHAGFPFDINVLSRDQTPSILTLDSFNLTDQVSFFYFQSKAKLSSRLRRRLLELVFRFGTTATKLFSLEMMSS